MVGLRWWGELTPTGCLLGWDHRAPVPQKALESPIVRAVTPAWQGLIGQIRAAFVMFLACHRVTHAAPVTGLIEHAEGCDRVARFLAPGVCLWFLWIGRAMARSRRAIMPTRGGGGTHAVCWVASSNAPSAAFRAGSSAGCAHARCNTAWRRCLHFVAVDCDIPKSWPWTAGMGCCVTEVRMQSRLSAPVGQGPLLYGRYRRLGRGGPAMVRSCR
jgi:hypothetical protein